MNQRRPGVIAKVIATDAAGAAPIDWDEKRSTRYRSSNDRT